LDGDFATIGHVIGREHGWRYFDTPVRGGQLAALKTLQDRTGRSDNSVRQTGDPSPARAVTRMQIYMEMNRTATIGERKTISIMKACELVGVSRRTIYNWIAGGKVEYVRTAGGSVRIFVDTLWREPARTENLVRKEAS
jgi:excisionase family DNA binding protein